MNIKNMDRFNQFIDFTGMMEGNIQPMDIDCMIEYHDEAYIFFEFKYGNKSMPYGQRKAYERLTRDKSSKGKTSITLVIEHNVHNCKENVIGKDCYVREYYLSSLNKWLKPLKRMTAYELIPKFLKYVG
jgi:hypothetical protein